MRPFLFTTACALALAATVLPTHGQQTLSDRPVVSVPLDLNSGSPASPPTVSQALDEPTSGLSPRNASYDIDVRLDHTARTLSAHETIQWRNISSRATSELQFHLYWNAWRNADSTWLRERQMSGTYTSPREDGWGSMDVTSLRVRKPGGDWQPLTSQIRFVAPDDGNTQDHTVATVPLATPIEPGATIDIDIEWTASVPRPLARTGYLDDYYFIGQWFPKLGVLEDAGWNTHQFHSSTEFYADFGVYDVRITVPDTFIVGASGQDVGHAANADGTTTHRYHGEDIHDFAWTASPHFIDLSSTFEHPTLPTVAIRLLLQPEHLAQAERYFAITNATLRLYGEWFGAYPYGNLTIVDPAFQSRTDGMEYPTLVTARSRWLTPDDVQVPEQTLAHEVGHQWWYGMVATNEAEHAWMDEGLNTFTATRVLEEVFAPNHVATRHFGGFVPWSLTDVPVSRLDNEGLPRYRLNGEADAPWTPTFRYWPSTASVVTYSKTALWLHTLEHRLGWPTLRQVLALYFERWKFRHPRPADFFDTVREVTGQSYFAFFDEVYRSSNTFDYGVQQFLSQRQDDGRYRTTVVVGRFGEALSPVEVVTTFANGEQIRETWDGQDRRAIYAYNRPSRALTVEVDPDRTLVLDVDYTNNSRTTQPRGRTASLKWSLTWMVWLQDLMLTYGFFL